MLWVHSPSALPTGGAKCEACLQRCARLAPRPAHTQQNTPPHAANRCNLLQASGPRSGCLRVCRGCGGARRAAPGAAWQAGQAQVGLGGHARGALGAGLRWTHPGFLGVDAAQQEQVLSHWVGMLGGWVGAHCERKVANACELSRWWTMGAVGGCARCVHALRSRPLRLCLAGVALERADPLVQARHEGPGALPGQLWGWAGSGAAGQGRRAGTGVCCNPACRAGRLRPCVCGHHVTDN